VSATTISPQMRLARAMTEGELVKHVMEYARLCGWLRVHILPARVKGGRMMTPYQGDSGMPDMVLARAGRTLLVELKRQTNDDGRVSEAQQRWLDASGGYCWRPIDWLDGTIHDVLK
jgi:hypothetical protein